MNLLFIGNSYTYFHDLPALFAALADEDGHPVTVHSVTQGGRKLCQFLCADDAYTKQLDAVLAQNAPFDAVVIQEQSLLPYRDYDAFFEGAAHVAKTVRDAGCARIVFYATWGRRPGCPTLDELGWTHDSMTEGLASAYRRAAETLGAEVAFVGYGFREVLRQHPEIGLYDDDGSHPSYAGSCLAAMTVYRTVFGEIPAASDSMKLDAGTAAALIGAVRRLYS